MSGGGVRRANWILVGVAYVICTASMWRAGSSSSVEALIYMLLYSAGGTFGAALPAVIVQLNDERRGRPQSVIHWMTIGFALLSAFFQWHHTARETAMLAAVTPTEAPSTVVAASQDAAGVTTAQFTPAFLKNFEHYIAAQSEIKINQQFAAAGRSDRVGPLASDSLFLDIGAQKLALVRVRADGFNSASLAGIVGQRCAP